MTTNQFGHIEVRKIGNKLIEVMNQSSLEITPQPIRQASLQTYSKPNLPLDRELIGKVNEIKEFSEKAVGISQDGVVIYQSLVSIVETTVRLKNAVASYNYKLAQRTERLESVLPLVKQEVIECSKRIDRTLDKVLEIDTAQCTYNELDHHRYLIELISKLQSNITIMLVNLINA